MSIKYGRARIENGLWLYPGLLVPGAEIEILEGDGVTPALVYDDDTSYQLPVAGNNIYNLDGIGRARARYVRSGHYVVNASAPGKMNDVTFDMRFPPVLPVWNVQEWGAVGDGVAIDTLAVQQAVIDTSGKGILFFPPGQYRLTFTIYGRNNTYLKGVRGQSWLVNDSNSPIFNNAANSHGAGNDIYNITYEDLAFDGQGDVRTGDVGNPTIIVQPTSAANTASNITIKGCEFYNMQHRAFCTRLFGVTDAWVIDNWFHDIRRDAIHIGDFEEVPGVSVPVRANRVVVAHNNIHNSGFEGTSPYTHGDDQIAIWGGENIVVVNNNSAPNPFHGRGRSIVVGSAKNVIIAGNNLSGAHRSNIGIFSYDVPSMEDRTDLVIANNTMDNAGGYERVTAVTIDGVPYTEEEAPYYGFGDAIDFDMTAGGVWKRIIIKDNVIRTPLRHGIHLRGEVDIESVSIEGNHIEIDHAVHDSFLMTQQGYIMHGGRGINCESPVAVQGDLRIRNNTIRNTYREGIYMKGANIRRLFIEGNDIKDVGVAAEIVSGGSSLPGQPSPFIYVEGVEDVHVDRNNTVETRGTPYSTRPLHIVNPVGAMSIVGNDFRETVSAQDPLITGAGTLDELKIRDNLGWKPFRGTMTASGFTPSGGFYIKAVTQAYPFAIPTSAYAEPSITVTPRTAGVGCAVTSRNGSGFTVTFWSTADPAVTVTADWIVEV